MIDVTLIDENIEQTPLSVSASYSTGTAQDAVLVNPRDYSSVKLSFELGAGTAKVQYTNDPFAMVRAGSATWVDWDVGDVSATNCMIGMGITAFRCYRTSGIPRMVVAVGPA